ncbi:AsmA family protein [Candidatus Anaplasma sp. TIGMIC]|uniref:AsmA family protein n=1 Tax=Candidatus Anaplasma sp. TIGMIC TaxID=3020713 RepID=UPI00232AE090|nr:AsmA family protein [Candidatus Anaplasma sp. TIGMIC]MDB1135342.1 AsmA family protein [Candidatus Anaplasma sp. TIGMIC]
MKLIGYLFCAVLLAIFGAAVAPYVVDWNARYGDYVFAQLGAATRESGVVIKALGNIRGQFLIPRLTASNLYLECSEDSKECSGAIAVERLEMRLSLLPLITGRAHVKSVDIYGLRTDASSLSRIVRSQASGGIKKIRIFDSVIADNSGVDATHRSSIYIRQGEIRSRGGTYESQAELRIGSARYELHSTLESQDGGSRVANVELSSTNTKVVLSGSGRRTRTADVVDISDLQKGLFRGFEWVLDARTNNLTELAQVAAIATKVDGISYVNSSEKLSMNAHIKQKEDGGFEVTSLDIDSGSISGHARGECSDTMSCKAQLVLSSVDIDSLFRSDIPDVDASYSAPMRRSSAHFPLVTAEFDAKAELDIREIRYKGSVARNLDAKVSIRDGKVAIDQLRLDLPGRNNILRISGSSVNAGSDSIPRFTGAVYAQGEDIDALLSWVFPIHANELRSSKDSGKFVLESKLYIAPRIVALPGIRLTSQRARAEGNLKYKYGKKGGVVIGGITVSGFSTSDYSVEGMDMKRDVASFAWLRNVMVPLQVLVKFQDFSIGHKAVKELSFLADVSGRRMNLEKIHFVALSGDESVSEVSGSARVSLSSQGVRPKVFLDLKGDKYSSEFLWLPKFLERNAPEGASKKVWKEGMSKFTWSSKPINLSVLEGIDGSVSVRIKSFSFADKILKDLSLASTLKEGVMSIDHLNFRKGKGRVRISGNVGLGEVSSMSVVIAASDVSVDVKEAPTAHAGNLVSGNVSVSGSLQMQGKNVLEWANSVKGKLKFASRRLGVKGVDFDGFITTLFNAESKAEIASLSRVSLYQGDTVFEKFDGEMEIDRGAVVSSAQFRLKNAVGAASVNLFIPQFTVTSLCRFTFIPPRGGSPENIDMSMEGYLWHPNPTFDIDRLFEIVRKNR